MKHQIKEESVEYRGQAPLCGGLSGNVQKNGRNVSYKKEQSWEKQAEYFKWMLDEYGGNAYISDMENYDLLYVNQTSCETLGLPREKLIGCKCYEAIQGRTSPCPFCTNDCLTEEEFYEWEYYNQFLRHRYFLKDRIIEWEGKKVRLELSHDNLSSEYKLEKKDREREAILRTIPGGFARVDARDMRTVLWYGGGFLKMIGYTRDEFENILHSKCTYVHPDDIERAAKVMEISRETGEDTAVEGRIITRDGTVKILTMTYSYVSAENSWDGIESFYSVGIDVTKEREEQERQSKALEEAYQTARVANSAKTNFLSSMSHDIRTPMNAIMGMTTIAKANLDSKEKVCSCLDKIDTSSQHLLNLINEVLDMSKIESGKIDLTLEEVNLHGLLKSVSEICRPLISQKHQEFRSSIAQVRHKEVIADGERLKQVMLNLLSNAIKYTPEGGRISLRINELYSPNPKKSQYEFICIDTGIGISEDFRPYVFEPFWRAEDPRISKSQGTGLGMAITENIVRMMNGTIRVESKTGAGSKFTASIPLDFCRTGIASENRTGESRDSGNEPSCPPEAAENGQNSGRADAGPALESAFGINRKSAVAGKRILLAEDNDINREIAEELLKMEDVNVDAVENGRQALEAFAASKEGEYDAILMDIQMPVMNGYDAAAAIRALDREDAGTIPIIALTANAFTADVAKARELGMNDHVAKPIDINRLYIVLQKWTGNIK